MSEPRIAEQLEPLAVPIDDLREDPANVRRHDERNVAAIAASLEAYGQQKPVVVRKGSMIVVAGNGTLAAARSLGWDRLAASIVEMDEATAARFAIADNRTAELAVWDDEGLARMIDALAGDEDFDPLALGFSEEEVERMRKGLLFDLPDGAEGTDLDPDELEGKVKKIRCPECGSEFPA